MGGGQGSGGGQGVFTGVDGVVGDAGGVYHTGGGETARSRGVWGSLVSTRRAGRDSSRCGST
jgi:hypothetical protein